MQSVFQTLFITDDQGWGTTSVEMDPIIFIIARRIKSQARTDRVNLPIVFSGTARLLRIGKVAGGVRRFTMGTSRTITAA